MIKTAMKIISKHATVASIYLCIFASLMASCVKETLCEEGEHPHRAYVKFAYDFSGLPEYFQPYMGKMNYLDSMLIIGNRVINQRRSAFLFSTYKNSGRYKTDLPDTILVKDNHDITEFTLPTGEYKFWTANLNSQDYIYTNLEQMLETGRLLNTGDLTLESVTYDGNSDQLPHPKEWIDPLYYPFDKNIYASPDGKVAGFIRNVKQPIVIDSTSVIRWESSEPKTVTFYPKTVTQNIDMFFDITKATDIKFVVDSVWCIISGVPHKVNVGTGALEIDHTDKLQVRTNFVDPNTVPTVDSQYIKDGEGNTKLRCYANFNVTGIVENTYTDVNKYAGAGVMQLIMYVHITDPEYANKKKVKALIGMVNLHKSLENAKLQTLNAEDLKWRKTRDHSVLYLSFNANITKEMLYGVDNAGIVDYEEVDIPDQFIIY